MAAVHGYADQSHLVRDFRAFAGCAPSRWLADESGSQSGSPSDSSATEFGFVQA